MRASFPGSLEANSAASRADSPATTTSSSRGVRAAQQVANRSADQREVGSIPAKLQ